MNIVPVVAERTGVAVIVFVLMSNHVHFLLESNTKEWVKAFFDRFKMVYSGYLHKKYGVLRFLRENDVDIQDIPSVGESLERTIAYIQMNPVAANICSHPSGYQWGCGPALFNTIGVNGTAVGALSRRTQYSLFHTRPPESLLGCSVGEDGYIFPATYIRKGVAEGCFRTPKRYNYFLASSSKVRQKAETEPVLLPSFRDQSLVSMAQDICFSLFGHDPLCPLDPEEERRLVLEMRRRSSADVKQLARILGVPAVKIAGYLDES